MIPQSDYVGAPDFQSVPFNYPDLPSWKASSLFDSLLPIVGASLPYRDYADYYVVDEVKSLGLKGELIANEASLPFGAPSSWDLWKGSTRVDTDNDGMPDEWEAANGTNAGADDAMTIASNGYTNIENYINSITRDNSEAHLRKPLNLQKDSASQNSVYLSWLDYTEGEKGFSIEKQINGVWVPIDSTLSNVNHIVIGGMQPEQSDTLRVKAFNDSMASEYSNVLIAKSKPVIVPVLDTANFIPDLVWTGTIDSTWNKNTANWINKDSISSPFVDSSKLLFPQMDESQVINVNDSVAPGDILIQGDNDYSFNGPGTILGNISLNKTGKGKVSLNNLNNYSGPTVLHNGTIAFKSLANGDSASSIGASANYAFNWRWQGGTWLYTGASTSTDRNAIIDNNTAFNIKDSNVVVTLTGALSGDGGLIKSGPGKLLLRSENTYSGQTVINGGVLEIQPISSATQADDIIDENRGIGTSNILRLHNGTYRTSGGSNTIYENYPLDLYVDDSTINGFEPNRNANLSMTVHGSGTLNYEIPYLRELIQGDWSDFSGTLVANSNDEGLLVIDNNVGFPNNRLVVTGSTKIVNWDNEQTVSIGGLSGEKGTKLSCGGVKTQSFGFGYSTYSVGSAGTDETFKGVINNEPYGATSNTTGETSIVKVGEGYWRLTGSNTYSGTTTITSGKLIVNGSNSGTGNVYVNGGILAGLGSITGNVESMEGGILEPGDSSLGTLTLKSSLFLDSGSISHFSINKSLDSSDRVVVGDSIVYGGILSIDTTVGLLAPGDKFKLFETSGYVSGTFTSFSPQSPGDNLFWKFKPATGELMVSEPGYVFAPSNIKLDATTDILTSQSTINVSWVDNSDSETYFILERAKSDLNFVEVAQLNENSTSFIDSLLAPNTTYYYRLRAMVSNAEMSTYSDTAVITTPVDYYPPVSPTIISPANNAQLTGLLDSKVNLRWKGGEYTDSFAVYLGKDSLNLIKLGNLGYADTSSMEATRLKANSTYYWRVDAHGDGHETPGTVWSFATGDSMQLIAHYTFDEQTGDTAYDATKNHLNAISNFSPTWYVDSGKLAGAVDYSTALNDISAFSVPTNETLDLDSMSFSISLWVKIPSNTYSYADGKDCYLIQKGTMEANTGKWYGLQLKDNNLTFAIDDGKNKSSLSVKMEEDNNIYDNEWDNIVAVRDLKTKKIYLYINGTLAGSTSSSSTTNIGQMDKMLTIGNSVENKPYRDRLDDIRFYNNALSASDIEEIYQMKDPISNPVSATDFDGKDVQKGILLHWITNHEVNSNLFELYRSSDSINYHLIKAMAARGYTDSVTGYEVIDNRPNEGINYYKLIHLDMDGQRRLLAKTSVARNSREVTFDVYPNPFYGNQLNFKLKGFTRKNKFRASFYRLNGAVIKSKDFAINASGHYSMEINRRLNQGIYLLTVSDGIRQKVEKVLVK